MYFTSFIKVIEIVEKTLCQYAFDLEVIQFIFTAGEARRGTTSALEGRTVVLSGVKQTLSDMMSNCKLLVKDIPFEFLG